MPTFTGTPNADTLTGTLGADILDGREGADSLEGLAGDDSLFGGRGRDTLKGGAGRDYLDGQEDDDLLEGGDDDDTLVAGGGQDTVDGQAGNDRIFVSTQFAAGAHLLLGGLGNDSIAGGILGDTLDGGDGQDLLSGGAGNDRLIGGAGDDLMDGQDGADDLSGGDGDDSLIAGGGADTLDGEAGNDRLFVSTTLAAGAYLMRGGLGNDSINSGALNDTLEGNEGNDRIFAGAGDDQVSGGAGDDYLDGQAGADTITGGEGNDTLVGGGQADTLDGGAGDDYFFVTGSTPTSGMRMYGGGGRDTLVGSELADMLDGGDDDDSLYGDGGDDLLSSGDGNDYLDGQAGSDHAMGGAGDDTLVGGGGRDTLEGGPGNDRLFVTGTGTAGNTLLQGGDGDDVISGGADQDTLQGDNGQDQLYAGGGHDWLLGGAGDDILLGQDGADTLDGGAGADKLYGGAGDDFYILTDRLDLVIDNLGQDTALIQGDWIKVPTGIEVRQYAPGVQALPYWIDALTFGDAHWYSTLVPADKTFRFAFPTQLPSYDTSAEHADGYTPFTAEQIARTELALSYVASQVDLRFVRTNLPDQPNTLAFASNLQPRSGGYANTPSDQPTGSDVFLSNADYNRTLQDGTYGAHVLMHEIGHALGLKHPVSGPDAVGDVGEGPYLSGPEDNSEWTIMSYDDRPQEHRLVLSPLDIAALHYLYGPNPAARAGNDVYRLSATASNFIWDGAGIDTLSAADCPQGCTIYLAPGYWSHVGATRAARITSAGQITVNFGTVIENLQGSAFGDVLIGNEVGNEILGESGDDRLAGGLGADTLIGGTGNDTLDGGADALDVAVYAGVLADYGLAASASGNLLVVQDRVRDRDGLDVVQGIEVFRFADGERTLAQILAVARSTTMGAPVSANGTAMTPEDTILAARLPAATDPDNDPVSYYKVSDPAQGTVSVSPDGAYTYTPSTNFHGTDVFSFAVSDGKGGASVYTQTITIAPVNDAPMVTKPLPDQEMMVGRSFGYTVSADAFQDVDGDALMYSARRADGSPLPDWLRFDAATRRFSGTPGPDQVGTLEVEVTASDGTLRAADIFAVRVLSMPVNLRLTQEIRDGAVRVAAFADADLSGSYALNLSFAYTASLLTLDTVQFPGSASSSRSSSVINGVGQATLSASVSSWPARDVPLFTLVFTGSGQGNFDIDFNRLVVNGVAALFTDPQALPFNIPAPAAPVSAAGSASTLEDRSLSAQLPAASDANGDSITYARVTGPANGTVTVAANGAYTYTPKPDFFGVDTFSFSVSDGKTGSNSYTMTITVDPVNDAPTASGSVGPLPALSSVPLTYVVPADTVRDVDSPVLTWRAERADGTALPAWLSFEAATRRFTGTPSQADEGSLSLRIVVSDGQLQVEIPISLDIGASRVGTAAAESIRGTALQDRIFTGGGADTVSAGEGNDDINATVLNRANLLFDIANYSGGIQVLAGPGDDNVFGTSDGDSLLGESGSDVLMGLAGRDTLTGGPGSDVLHGGEGLDTAVFSGGVTGYRITLDRARSTVVVEDRSPDRDGTDRLASVEVLQFAGINFELFNPPRAEQPQYNRSTSFLFDAALYLLNYKAQIPSLTMANAVDHYFSGGAAQGLKPNAWFDPSYYANRWADLKALNLSADILFLHYNLYGVWEGRSAGPVFDTFDGNRYLRENPDVAGYVDAYVADFLGSRTNGAIAHFIIYGAAEGRKAFDATGAEVSQVITIGVPTAGPTGG